MSQTNKKTTKNGVSYEQDGWIYISVHGSPKERGYAIGFLGAEEFKEIQKTLEFNCMEEMGYSWKNFFVTESAKLYNDKIKKDFPEFYEEMEGIYEGCVAGGTETTLDEIIAWNNSISLLEYWFPNMGSVTENKHTRGEGGSADRCSGFIACGEYTEGEPTNIVMAHNSFCPFLDGQYYNVILDINPDKYEGKEGVRMLLQTNPCWIWSGSDVFVTGAGIMGTETTIGGFSKFENNAPISCRIRNAMQYGKKLDDYETMLLKDNSGDYANSWLLGDTNTGEIMRIELGLKYHKTEVKKDGYFIGCNVAFDPEVRNLECGNTGYCDIRRHQGSRQVRLPDLMEDNKGKINVEIAKKIIADHYDVYLNKENPCSRTVCSHYELDPREYMSDPSRPKPFQPRGAVDGAVTDSAMTKKMSLAMRWGSSCGTAFDKTAFCDKHRQWKHIEDYLRDRPSQPWSVFTTTDEKGTTKVGADETKKDNGSSKSKKAKKDDSKGGRRKLTRKKRSQIVEDKDITIEYGN
jgi:hypothetical protein